MAESNVIRTHVYGKNPHDVYDIALTGRDGSPFKVEIREPGLDELTKALGDGFIISEEIEPTLANMEAASKCLFDDDSKLAFAKEMLRRAITFYDKSDAVNGFYLESGDRKFHYWLPAQLRNQLVTAVTSWSDKNDEYTLDLREYAVSLSIHCNTLLRMLTDLENYAVECYHTTSAHLNAIAVMTTVTDLTAYDYTAGYPDKLTFNI